MNKRVLLLAFLAIMLNVNAQKLSYGIKIGLGSGTISSDNLQKFYDYKNQKDADIKTYSAEAKLGYDISFGAQVANKLSDKISIVAEPSLSLFKSTIQINRMDDDSQSGTLSQRETTTSNNAFTINSFDVPVLIRYNVVNDFYINAGLSYNYIVKSELTYDEVLLKEDITANVVTSTNQDLFNGTVAIDNIRKAQLFGQVGIGKNFNLLNSMLGLELRYSMPFNSSELYSKTASIDGAKESDIFGISDKNNAYSDGYNLNDFKYGKLNLIVSYTF